MTPWGVQQRSIAGGTLLSEGYFLYPQWALGGVLFPPWGVPSPLVFPDSGARSETSGSRVCGPGLTQFGWPDMRRL